MRTPGNARTRVVLVVLTWTMIADSIVLYDPSRHDVTFMVLDANLLSHLGHPGLV